MSAGAPDAAAAAADAARLAELARALADALDAALGPWVERSILARLGAPASPEVAQAAAAAAAEAQRVVGARIRALLEQDIDEQRSTPLALVRGAVRWPTAVLAAAGAAPAARDEWAVRRFPDDVYGLTPAAFTDVDPALAEPGLLWGAAKAHVHLQRRRAEGRR
ncbi:MAG: hypothetical protein ACKVWR_19890 [Acidimicrobiales bacterium]